MLPKISPDTNIKQIIVVSRKSIVWLCIIDAKHPLRVQKQPSSLNIHTFRAVQHLLRILNPLITMLLLAIATVFRLGVISAIVIYIQLMVQAIRAMQSASETNPDLVPDWSVITTLVLSCIILPMYIHSVLLRFSVVLERLWATQCIAMVLLAILYYLAGILHGSRLYKVMDDKDQTKAGGLMWFIAVSVCFQHFFCII